MLASRILTSPIAQKTIATAAVGSGAMSFYSLSATKGDGESIDMEEFRGKVVYATNVASKWGLTRREYAQFERLGERWGDDLVIMAFPSREFFTQEYDNDAAISDFAKTKNFPGILMKLGNVLGDKAPEVWKFFKAETGAPDPTWNFKGKFLVSKNGSVSVPKKLEKDIEALMMEEVNEE